MRQIAPSAVNAERFASGFCQYPFITCGPFAQISPASPSATSLSPSSRSLISVDGRGRPIVPVNSLELNLLAVATGDVSDRP